MGTAADGVLLIALVAALLPVLLGTDPAVAGGGRVEGKEAGPRLLKADAEPPGVRRLDRRDPVLEGLLAGAPVALERELDVLGGHGIAVVKPGTLAEDELVGEAVP